jgi:hypothetical protein
MAGRQLFRLPVRESHHNEETCIPVGIVEGRDSGPALAVMGGVRGSEYAAHDGTDRFWGRLWTLRRSLAACSLSWLPTKWPCAVTVTTSIPWTARISTASGQDREMRPGPKSSPTP